MIRMQRVLGGMKSKNSSNIFEFGFLVIGWACIFTSPAIASIRCLRVCRYIWYFELFINEEEEDEFGNPIDLSEETFSLTKACSIGLSYLESIGQELFTQNSKGGVILLGMFFYSSYILAIICVYYDRDFIVTGEGFNTCGTITQCFIIMIRLACYDGTGFDFLAAVVAKGQGGLALLLFLYLIFNAIIILNGLIGIFGTAFVEFEGTKNIDDIYNVVRNDEVRVVIPTTLELNDDSKPVTILHDINSVDQAMIKNEKLFNRLLNEVESMKASVTELTLY